MATKFEIRSTISAGRTARVIFFIESNIDQPDGLFTAGRISNPLGIAQYIRIQSHKHYRNFLTILHVLM
jgi:hypothetical protein